MNEGLLISEVPLGYSPTRWRFLQRNRLIAALTCATIVVEARWRSGALNTAHHALEIGRELFAVPGQIFSPTSEGCHRLFNDGYARIATNSSAVLNQLNDSFEHQIADQSLFDLEQSDKTPFESLNISQSRVWDALPLRKYASVESLMAMSGVSNRDTILALSQLRQKGLAEHTNNGWRKSKNYLKVEQSG